MDLGWCCLFKTTQTLTLRFRYDQDIPQSLDISFTDETTGEESESVRIPDLRKAKVEKDNTKKIVTKIRCLDRFFVPGAVQVTSTATGQKLLFLVSITVTRGKKNWFMPASLSFPAFSWISSDQGKRTFFSGIPKLPEHTPKGIRQLRAAELQEMKRDSDNGERKGSERVYDYELYNDLSHVKQGAIRAPLGGSKASPYPRRLRTGRPMDPSGTAEVWYTNPETGKDVPFWVPHDDSFFPEKIEGFVTRAAEADKKSAALVGSFGGPAGKFSNMRSIKNMYEPLPEVRTLPMPKVFQGREDAWKSDVEFGRQRIAGLNPTTIESITSLPKTSSITDAFVRPALLGGGTLEQRLREKKMYMIDYTPAFLDLVEKINSQKGGIPRFQYAPRCLFYWNEQKQLMPVAIELSTPTQRIVYTPQDSLTEWTLAKAHFLAADFAIHELHTHLNRCHAAAEPYQIATRRCLSSMHPVFRLLMPHFVDTLQVNMFARFALIDAGGGFETLFTAGKYIGEAASTWYGKYWRFKTEGLPADLMKRNMATAPKGANWQAGEIDLVLEDYPFAQDGILIWRSIYKWVSDYLQLYYTHSTDVSGDVELQSWWEEIKTKGHPDIVFFKHAKEEEVWPPMVTISDLTYILCTIIWVVTAQHSAINFGQYDYAAYMPNTPSYMVAPMPPPGAVSTPSDVLDEGLFLSSMPPPAIAAGVAVVLEELSTIGEDDVMLGTEVPHWHADPRAKKVFKSFSRMVSNAEKKMLQRNSQISNPSRSFPYTLMLPSLTAGDAPPALPFRGITNSIAE